MAPTSAAGLAPMLSPSSFSANRAAMAVFVGLQKRCRIGVGQFDMTVADETIGSAARTKIDR